VADEESGLASGAGTDSPAVDHPGRLDALYKQFPSFDEWVQVPPRKAAWDQRVRELKDASLEDGLRRQAEEVALRAAAFDTGAIEGLYTTTRGLTMSVAHGEVDWERDIPTVGSDVAAAFAAQLGTYRAATSDIAADALPASQAWIRELHAAVTAAQETYTIQTPQGPRSAPMLHGAYKEFPNHVVLGDETVHAYAPVIDTAPEMERFVAELASPPFAEAHSIVQAAYAHYVLVAIHPFADGNGRVARALASAYLYRGGQVPFLVFADQRAAYFDALNAADGRRFGDFNGFVADASIAALGLVADSARALAAPSLDSAAERYSRLVTVHPGVTHTDLDQVASRLVGQAVNLLAEIVEPLGPKGISAGLSSGSGNAGIEPSNGYRSIIQSASYLSLSFETPGPANARRDLNMTVVIAVSPEADADLLRLITSDGTPRASFSLQEVHPTLTGAAEQRLRLVLRTIVANELDQLVATAHSSLAASGYPVPE
jgi:Fic family protein